MNDSIKKSVCIGEYIDPDTGRNPVFICYDQIGTLNYSATVYGATGSGKTYAIDKQMISGAEIGNTYLVLDCHNTMSPDMIPDDLKEEFEKKTVRFNAYENSIPCHLMSPLDYPDGIRERVFDTAAFQTEVLSNIYRFGIKQEPVCRSAIKAVISRGTFSEEGYRAVGKALDDINTEVSMNVKEKIESLLDHNVFVEGDFPLEEGRINVFDLYRYDLHSQIIIAELLLHYVWRQRIAGLLPPLFIVIDEFQNIGMRKDGILSTILAEGRRFGINAILLTQSMRIHFTAAQVKLLMQPTYKFFFKPSEADLKEFADIIDPHAVTDSILALRDLECGECIVCGPKYMNGKLINKPLKVVPCKESVAGNGTGNSASSDAESDSSEIPTTSHVDEKHKMRVPIKFRIESKTGSQARV